MPRGEADTTETAENPSPRPPNKSMKVGIVGAGITGLALTHYLAREGIDSTAFEATPSAGGVISSREVDGHVLEVGPQRMRLTPGVQELAAAAGVSDAIVTADEGDLYVYADDTLGEAPLSARALIRTDLLTWRGKLRLLAEPLTRPGRPEETVAEVFTRKFGRETYERFVGPLYGGLYGSDPAEMPAAFALEGLLEREQETRSLLRAFMQRVGSGHESPPITFESGNQQLPAALADTYRDRVELDTPVTDIARLNTPADAGSDGAFEGGSGSSKTGTDHQFVLSTPGGTHVVDELVVTTPARVTAELLDGVVSGADRLRELRYNHLAVVYLAADHGHVGKGYQVGYTEDLHTLGVSFNGKLFGRDGVNTAFLGGMREPELLQYTDERIGHIARSEFETVVGTEATVIDVARLEPGFPAWDSSWWALDDLELPPDVRLATNYTGRMGIPSRVREARSIATTLSARREQ